jgi:hypothetical protein
MVGFLELVHEALDYGTSIPKPFCILYERLYATANKLSRWGDHLFGSVKLQILLATCIILQINVAMKLHILFLGAMFSSNKKEGTH